MKIIHHRDTEAQREQKQLSNISPWYVSVSVMRTFGAEANC
jgi:hypothetical protein